MPRRRDLILSTQRFSKKNNEEAMIYFKNFLRAKTLHTKNVAACNGFSITEPPHSFGTEGLNIFYLGLQLKMYLEASTHIE